MEPYTPADSLVMSRGAKAYVDGGKGIIEYPGPYARFQYYGKVMVGVTSGSAWANKNESKIVTGKNLQYSKFRHPLATSHWDKAMKSARGKDLETAIQNYIKKKV
ncbi:Minor capsid protein [Parasporobacterium paucivorans DSM 15970]|uniref:Minor capsid protein n=2 Tax=Parasporobacterium TaxID=115543 RepID=A0A1M6B283_9FIRM|nr:Minor capsid protein [Parasporobacterium paucivorans DSM 15970]